MPTTSCSPCDAGETSFQGATTCINCAKGKFATSEGLKECTSCPSAWYQPQENKPSTKCEKCPTGWSAIFDENGKEIQGSAVCLDLNLKGPEDCIDDEYFNTTSSGCVDCPPGGSCVGAINLSGVISLFGWARCPPKVDDDHEQTYYQSDPLFEECAFGAACQGASNYMLKEKYVNESDLTIDLALADLPESCADGYIKNASSANLLCASCASGYSRSNSVAYRCDKCPTDEENIGLAVTVSILGIIVLVWYVLLTLSDAGRLQPADGAIGIGVSYVQVVSLLLTFPIAW